VGNRGISIVIIKRKRDRKRENAKQDESNSEKDNKSLCQTKTQQVEHRMREHRGNEMYTTKSEYKKK
jgi:hypothetical protein